ncbi:rRNA-processing protein efg1 [Lecanicillium sp. MT-2017a]|nr:rRNA-processing protein efg1 [Lecanicillium sp. MT-2017a]
MADNGDAGHRSFSGGKKKAKHGSTEFARKRIRNIERLFQRNADLPANVRNDLERELAAHKAIISDKSFQKRRSAMISKYHMVRFFERKKASRLVKQLKRKVEQEEDQDARAELKRDLHVAEVDEAYTLYHPHAEPYISLYGNASKGDDEDDIADKTPKARAALASQRPEMWSVVEKTMEHGKEALQQLRERRSPEGNGQEADRKSRPRQPQRERAARPVPQQKPPQESGGRTAAGKTQNGAPPQLNRRERRKRMREAMAESAQNEDDSGDGGGFFEEA